MKRIASYILSIIGLGLLLYFIISLNFKPSTLYLIKKPEYIPASIGLFILTFAVSAIRMKYFLKSLKKEDIEIKTLIKIELVSKYIYYITPSKLYLPAKAILLNKQCNIRKSICLGITSFEYAIDTVITIVLALYGSVFLFKYTNNAFQVSLTIIFVIASMVSIAYILISQKMRDIIYKKINKIKNKDVIKYVTLIISIIKTTKDTWREILVNKKMRKILPVTIIQIIISAASTCLLFLSMETNIPLYWIIIVSASSIFLGGISQIPGGVGIREGTAILLYSLLGVPKEITLVVVLVSRIYTIIPLILGYWYSLNTIPKQIS